MKALGPDDRLDIVGEQFCGRREITKSKCRLVFIFAGNSYGSEKCYMRFNRLKAGSSRDSFCGKLDTFSTNLVRTAFEHSLSSYFS